MTTKTYSYTREHFAEVLDEAESSREPVIVTRRGREPMAIVPATELAGLMETAHLLRSPRNAARLLAALEQSRRGEGTVYTVEALTRTLGLASQEPDVQGEVEESSEITAR